MAKKVLKNNFKGLTKGSVSIDLDFSGVKIENKFSEISDPIYDFDEDVDSQIKLKTTSPQKTKNIVKRVRATKNNLENRKVRY